MSDPAKIAAAADAALIAQNSTGVPAALLIGQWALESGWGEHAPGNNCFGIKIYPGCFGRQLLRTTEWFTGPELAHFLASEPGRTATRDPHSTTITEAGREKYQVEDWFATFPTLAACFERRAKMFDLGRYKPITEQFRKDGNLFAFVKAFAPIYATDPGYGETLTKIISQQNVQMALNKARDTPGDVLA